MGVIGFNGGIVGPDNTPTVGAASGVWSLNELFNARDLGIWPSVEQLVEYLVVAGGGGGGGRHAAGGGAGGFRFDSDVAVVPATSYTVVVGSGGPGAPDGLASGTKPGVTGIASSVFGIQSAGGGGGGGHADSAGRNGGSGGGSGSIAPNPIGLGNTPATSPSQGNNGGLGQGVVPSLPDYGGGGGGGAGNVGGNAASPNAGVGGPGASSSITGSVVFYAGGGGGGGWIGYNGASGGVGGGGAGVGNAGSANAGNGDANTGSGGGGSGGDTSAGGNGGSGIVIIRYPDNFQNLLIGSGLQYRDSTGATVSGTGARVAPSYTPTGFKVYQFNGGTGNIQF